MSRVFNSNSEEDIQKVEENISRKETPKLENMTGI